MSPLYARRYIGTFHTLYRQTMPKECTVCKNTMPRRQFSKKSWKRVQPVCKKCNRGLHLGPRLLPLPDRLCIAKLFTRSEEKKARYRVLMNRVIRVKDRDRKCYKCSAGLAHIQAGTPRVSQLVQVLWTRTCSDWLADAMDVARNHREERFSVVLMNYDGFPLSLQLLRASSVFDLENSDATMNIATYNQDCELPFMCLSGNPRRAFITIDVTWILNFGACNTCFCGTAPSRAFNNATRQYSASIRLVCPFTSWVLRSDNLCSALCIRRAHPDYKCDCGHNHQYCSEVCRDDDKERHGQLMTVRLLPPGMLNWANHIIRNGWKKSQRLAVLVRIGAVFVDYNRYMFSYSFCV